MVIDLSFLSGKPYEVLGLARSGLAAARALVAGGADVAAWDDNADRRAAATDLPLADLHGRQWSRHDTLVISPGIPHLYPKPHPVAAAAKTAGAAMIGDIELLVRADGAARYVGVTGTNGKSTTTALIGHLLQSAGVTIAVGGNIGVPVCEFDALGGAGAYVLEMSSYQLELTPSLVCDVAVLLNVAPDHLDRHGGMGGYLAAKHEIFHPGARSQTAVIGVDDDHGRDLADDLARADAFDVVRISGDRRIAGGVYVIENRLIDDRGGQSTAVLDLGDIETLRGAHNHQNAAAAYAVARLLGVSAADIARAMADFPGLHHRQERVGALGPVTYVNDSKATNPDAARRALSAYENIYWIAGGRAKDGGLDGISSGDLGAVRQAYLIGEAAALFADQLRGRVETTLCSGLADAVQRAGRAAARAGGGVVLLSPACASFDQFASFEHRGDAFKAAVRDLAGAGAS